MIQTSDDEAAGMIREDGEGVTKGDIIGPDDTREAVLSIPA